MTYRDDVARYACRQLGDQLNSYMTGDPGSDSIAEYLAAGWLLTDDYYADDDQPRDAGTALIAALRNHAAAFDRLATELARGDVTLDSLRRIDLPRRPPAAAQSV
jgi:hypothetical protein